jgi:hypothetical protein
MSASVAWDSGEVSSPDPVVYAAGLAPDTAYSATVMWWDDAGGVSVMIAGGGSAMIAGGASVMIAGGVSVMIAGGGSVMIAGGVSVMIAGGMSDDCKSSTYNRSYLLRRPCFCIVFVFVFVFNCLFVYVCLLFSRVRYLS